MADYSNSGLTGSNKPEARRATCEADRVLFAAFWNRSCAYCRSELSRLWDVEHLTPLARGGRNTLANMAPACGPCNAKKGLATAEEFRHPEVPAYAARIVTLISAFWDGDRVATSIVARFGLMNALLAAHIFKPARLRGSLGE